MKVKIKKEWGVITSQETIKRIIKKLKMTWKRMKRRLGKEPDEWELEVKLPRPKELVDPEKKGEIDLRYLAQTGFDTIYSFFLISIAII